MSAFKQRRAQMEQPECEACGSMEVVVDSKQGHMVCTECGVILRQNMISTNSEYRNFSESDKPTGDPTRVAAGPLGTNVGAAAGDLQAYGLKNKAMMLGSASDRYRAANKMISNLVVKMGLPDEVKTTAQELYAVFSSGTAKVPDMAAASAAMVLEACRDCGINRTLKEICKAASPEQSMKRALSRAHRALRKQLQERQSKEAARQGIDIDDLETFRAAGGGAAADDAKNPLHAANMVPRFGSDLGFSSKGVQVAKKIAKAMLSDDLSEGLEHRSWHGRQPLTLTAATLYIALHLGSRVLTPGLPPRSLADVADITKVRKSTIEETYAELYPDLRKLIPETLKPPLTDAEWAAFPVPQPGATTRRR